MGKLISNLEIEWRMLSGFAPRNQRESTVRINCAAAGHLRQLALRTYEITQTGRERLSRINTVLEA